MHDADLPNDLQVEGATSRAASKMSRSRPSWSASIHADRSGEDMVSSEAIGRFL
jgi:hypothetical protein